MVRSRYVPATNGASFVQGMRPPRAFALQPAWRLLNNRKKLWLFRWSMRCASPYIALKATAAKTRLISESWFFSFLDAPWCKGYIRDGRVYGLYSETWK
jgi:hypothetical protein